VVSLQVRPLRDRERGVLEKECPSSPSKPFRRRRRRRLEEMKVFESLTFCRRVGCGNIYLIINEDEGAFYNLQIKGDMCKEAPCGESWFNAMARVLTYALRNSLWEGTTQKALVKHLLNNRCNNVIVNKDHIVSCADAIGRMILEYLKARNLHEEKDE